MKDYFQQLREYVNKLDLSVVSEDLAEELFVIEDPKKGISNMILDCEHPVLVIEQLICRLDKKSLQSSDTLMRLLQMNRNFVHGAFCIDESAETVIFRDTLRLDTLDYHELEASINSLSLALAENGNELLNISRV